VADPLNVELVAADRTVWSGEADMVIARTADGDIGILPGHAPVLGVLVPGPVQIRQPEGTVVAAVHGGFLSVADNRVGILAELVELADEIDLGRAQQALDRSAGQDDDEDATAAAARAQARIRARGLAG
jgi:F-type H+-transporting ATPase subunit epsilon